MTAQKEGTEKNKIKVQSENQDKTIQTGNNVYWQEKAGERKREQSQVGQGARSDKTNKHRQVNTIAKVRECSSYFIIGIMDWTCIVFL